MLALGDVHIYVSDFERSLEFWGEGLGLKILEKEVSPNAAYAMLEFSGGGALRLFGPVEPWTGTEPPLSGTYPSIRFDVVTDQFERTLVRLLEHHGRQLDEIETYDNLRVVSVADPDGNSFELLEIPPAGEDGADEE